MGRRSCLVWLGAALGLPLLMVGCGAPATPAASDRVGTQVAEARAVAATLTALAPGPPAQQPGTQEPATLPDAGAAATSAAPQPTAVAQAPLANPSPAPILTAPPVAAAPCTVQAANLRLRPGPGTIYEPPLAVLAAGTPLQPVGYVARGYPDGQWVQVRVVASGQTGWVSAAAQLVACTVNVANLPAAAAPPTPTAGATLTPTTAPSATPAPVVYVNVPVAGQNGDLKGDLVTLGSLLVKKNPLTFRDRVVLQVRIRDPKAGNNDGDGIDNVEFSISNDDGDEVAHQVENNAAYCSFGNSGPSCEAWVFKDHGNKWPQGQPATPGRYHVNINIQPKDSNRDGANWNFDFDLQ